MSEEAMDAVIEVTGASAGTAAPSTFIDPTGEEGGAAEVAELTAHGAQEGEVLAVGGGVVAADVGGAPPEAIAAGTEVKVESDEVEPYAGSYDCLICFNSVRGQPALNCAWCNCNPWHVACDKDKKYVENCPQCKVIGSMQTFTGASLWTAAPSDIVDLTGEGGGDEVGATLTEHGSREDAVPTVGGGMVSADVVGRDGAPAGQADAGSGSGSKGKEPVWAEAGPEAGGDGAATSAGAGAVGGGGGKGKGRVDNSPARGSSGGIGGGGQSGHSRGAGSSRAAEEQSGEGSRKRAAPDGDEGGSRGGGKRARGGKPGQCEHNRQKSRCKECGGGGICEHSRIRSRCKDCGGTSICQHNRERRRCKECGGGEHLPAQSGKEPLQRMWWNEHLQAQSEKQSVQGVCGGGHLRAQSAKEQMQRM